MPDDHKGRRKAHEREPRGRWGGLVLNNLWAWSQASPGEEPLTVAFLRGGSGNSKLRLLTGLRHQSYNVFNSLLLYYNNIG